MQLKSRLLNTRGTLLVYARMKAKTRLAKQSLLKHETDKEARNKEQEATLPV